MVKHQTLEQIPCQYLKGVGPRLAKLLEKCHVFSIQDILFHLPYRYQDRTRITKMRSVKPGDWVVIEGIIHLTEFVRRKNRPAQFRCHLTDQTAVMTLLFFHITPAQQTQLQNGVRLRCFGEIRYSNSGYVMVHPEYQIISTDHPLPVEQSLTPIYSTTEGLSQHLWRKFTEQALLQLNNQSLHDYLSDYHDNVLEKYSLYEALHYIHRPPVNADVMLLEQRQHPAQLRLAFEELLAHHLSLKLRREKIRRTDAPVFKENIKIEQEFIAKLPFQLTKAQWRVINEIKDDLAQSHPMLRLLQGDVGSGKTVVAAITALQAIVNHYQVAFMAPTEILAEQHYQLFMQWFPNCAWLSGQLTVKKRQEALEVIKNHDANIIIGTHALFQKEVEFAKLGLVIIDEQHRFGVEQRLALREKGLSPHQLIMTATPIPRTLAMTLYADLNLSVIDELPPGRTPIKTVVINAQRRDEIIMRVKKACQEKHQVYWVCPLIEESEALQCQAAETTAKTLQAQLPDLRIGLIHGRLKPKQKELIMQAFKKHDIDLLVATTVIEVGVDVPNASVMIIENAERLGLAQLHQLRGRVGRGSVESFCLMLYQLPLSALAEQRLRVMRESQDGFMIAEKDLELRGPGDLLGIRQTGLLNMRVADLQRDQHLFEKVQQTANMFLQKSPMLVQPLLQRWIGNSMQFQEV
jgi:ATP-dependent DNA helicase RecG